MATQVLGGPHPVKAVSFAAWLRAYCQGSQPVWPTGLPHRVLQHGARAAIVHSSLKGNDPSHRRGRPWVAGALSCGRRCMLFCQLWGRQGHAQQWWWLLASWPDQSYLSSKAGVLLIAEHPPMFEHLCLLSHARSHAAAPPCRPL